MAKNKNIYILFEKLIKLFHVIIFLFIYDIIASLIVEFVNRITHISTLVTLIDHVLIIPLAVAIVYCIKSKKKKDIFRIFFRVMAFISPIVFSIFSCIRLSQAPKNDDVASLGIPLFLFTLIISLWFSDYSIRFPFWNSQERTVGQLSSSVIKILNLNEEFTERPIYITKSNITHMKKKHPGDYNKYVEDIKYIIKYPTYVGIDNEDDSIEFTKEFHYKNHTDYVKVAVRPTSNNKLYVRTLYRVDKDRVDFLVKSGKLVEI